MKIGLIGCGKVGTTLFYLLKKNNHIVSVYDINKENEKRALKLLNIKKKLPLRELCIKSEALFFATPDDQLVKAFEKVKRYIRNKKYVFHFSGILTSSIFPKSRNIYRVSVHPFATFPRVIIPSARKRYFLFVEGDIQAIKAAQKIFSRRHFTIKKLIKKQKTYHHLVGIFASNLMVGLLSAIYELAEEMNWKEKDFREVVYPIIEETLKNIKKYKLRNALSGPLERGDIEVIKKHLKALKKNKYLLNIYKTLSMSTLKNVIRNKKRKEIEKLLR